MELTGIGLTLAPAIITGNFRLNAALAQQKAQTGADDGDAVLKIGQQRRERTHQ